MRNKKGQFVKGNIPWTTGKKRSLSDCVKMQGARPWVIPWNKGKKMPLSARLKMSEKAKSRKRERWDKSTGWRGDKIKYLARHWRIYQIKGKPLICEHCGKSKEMGEVSRMHWANIDHKYSLDPNDYLALCPKCHKRYDLTLNPARLNNIKKCY